MFLSSTTKKKIEKLYQKIIKKKKEKNETYNPVPSTLTVNEWDNVRSVLLDKLLYALLPLFVKTPSREQPEWNDDDEEIQNIYTKWRHSHSWASLEKINIFLTKKQEEYLRNDILYPNKKNIGLSDITVHFFTDKVQLTMDNPLEGQGKININLFVLNSEYNTDIAINELL